jgi:tetratricopeptide (TPR) repeat protein
MRVVPLIAAIALLSSPALGVEEIGVYAGRNRAALKLQNDGVAFENKGDYVNARKKFDEAIRLDPTMWPAYFNRATLNMKEHKFRQGLADATMALRGKSSFNRSAVLRAEINIKLGDYAAARRDLDTLLNLAAKSDAYAQALNVSAWLNATCPDARYRNGKTALMHATRACSLTSNKKADYVDTLAAAYAEIGDFDAAVRSEEKALAIADFFHEPKESRQHMSEHLASFKQHRPCRKVSD